jgi:hypothetical protein
MKRLTQCGAANPSARYDGCYQQTLRAAFAPRSAGADVCSLASPPKQGLLRRAVVESSASGPRIKPEYANQLFSLSQLGLATP